MSYIGRSSAFPSGLVVVDEPRRRGRLSAILVIVFLLAGATLALHYFAGAAGDPTSTAQIASP